MERTVAERGMKRDGEERQVSVGAGIHSFWVLMGAIEGKKRGRKRTAEGEQSSLTEDGVKEGGQTACDGL